MLITMVTDAGHCPFINRGSYAVWAKSAGRTVRHAGVLKTEVTDATVAELRAIANGLHIVLSELDPPRGCRIVAQTDSQQSIGAIKGTSHTRPQSRTRIASEISRINDLIVQRGIQLDLRYVEAHVGTGTPRHAVHDWCDRQCKVQLQEARRRAQHATQCRIPSSDKPSTVPTP